MSFRFIGSTGKWRPQRNTFPSARWPRSASSSSTSRSFGGSASTSPRHRVPGNAAPSPAARCSCVRTCRVDGTRFIYASLADNNDTFRRCPDIISLQGDDVRCEGEERSEEHTSELQSRGQLVCRLLLE